MIPFVHTFWSHPHPEYAVRPTPGAGTNGKLVLGTGCHVVLSGASTVRILVQ